MQNTIQANARRMPVSPSGFDTVNPGGVLAKQSRAFAARKAREFVCRIEPTRIIGREVHDRPIAAPQQATRTERRKQMSDVRLQIVGSPCVARDRKSVV